MQSYDADLGEFFNMRYSYSSLYFSKFEKHHLPEILLNIYDWSYANKLYISSHSIRRVDVVWNTYVTDCL